MNARPLIAASTLTLGLASLLLSCRSEPAPSGSAATTAPAPTSRRVAPIAGPTLAATRPVDLPGIHNVVAFDDGVYSGSVPEGREGFETLKAMGVKTILSVDGSQPELETSRALGGMRYVHLPIGYNGFDATRELEIARVIRDLPKPIYIHCHHGKHRSAGAAAAAMVVLGRMSPTQAIDRMKVSGTAANYVGLYRCASEAKVATAAQLDAASDAFPDVAPTTGMVQAMVDIDAAADHLKLIEKAGWKAPADHPDLVPAAEAGRLADAMRVLIAHHDTTSRNKPELEAWFKRSTEEAESLEVALAEGVATPDVLSKRFKTVMQSCKDCHAKYRD